MKKLLKGKKYFFFWKSKLSNWHPSNFIVDEIQYNCGEQYMMAMKARLFGDYETEKLIMNINNPREQQSLGRQVNNFNQKKWNETKYELVKKGLREKFKQNPDQMDYLLEHKDCIFVEASPYDRIWGIGYDKFNAEQYMDNWGENLLGKILTELANE